MASRPTPRPVTYPTSAKSDFPLRLAGLAAMIQAGLPLRCVALTPETQFDTHASQADTFTSGLSLIAEAIAAFQSDLEARGIADRVLLHVWTEFGRRAQENGGLGTDHGAAGVGMLIGTRTTGAMVGEWPALTNLDANGNQKENVDFRGVYASLLEQWFDHDAGVGDPRRAPLRPLPAHPMTVRRGVAIVMGAAAMGAGALAAGAGPSAAKLPSEGAPARLLVYAQEWSLWPSRPSLHRRPGDRAAVEPRPGRPRPAGPAPQPWSDGGSHPGGGRDPVGQAQPGHLAPVARDLRALLLDARPPQARHAHADHRPLTARAGPTRRQR